MDSDEFPNFNIVIFGEIFEEELLEMEEKANEKSSEKESWFLVRNVERKWRLVVSLWL